MNALEKNLQAAVEAGKLEKTSADNILFLLNQDGCEAWERQSVEELLADAQWIELNDRFYKTLSFGTGGLRGRTIGKVKTPSEVGDAGSDERPTYPAAGTNAMNYFNVGRATKGLANYLLRKFPNETPRLVIAHDTRHFSREFAELSADIASQLGVDAFLFEQERSTPELSFAVRHLKAHAGIVVTASHNPPHDNGYKVYFQDGAQIVEPHASGIIQEVLSVRSGKVNVQSATPGKIQSIGYEIDQAYLDALETLVLEPEIVKSQTGKLKIVYTPIHGTGIRIIPQILDRLGMSFSVTEAQATGDGQFPTVKSPNPENADALTLAIEQAQKEKADIVMGTDPDADRMGIAVRDDAGDYTLLTGNQIGSILAAYRLDRFFAKGILTARNASHATLIKTFVTTDLQKQIAESYGVKCVNTLTGFKYIGEKLKEYEDEAGGRGIFSEGEWRDALLESSTFFVFGGEESYGYSGGDYVRDKDANAAVLMAAEVASYAKSQGKTLLQYLDDIYLKHGFYSEKLGTLTFEGAQGAAKIKKLLETYKTSPPEQWANLKALSCDNYAEGNYRDVDGKRIPKELMLMFYLEGDWRVAVRASGTEPKIKFYFFGKAEADSLEALQSAKDSVKSRLEELWEFTRTDVESRVG